ncbi:GNAT family N-acetyltransferase [Litoribrevibacter albus]|uniref:N-acetyltransferase domain-containing protein n=1 Tax=Litoribrevibacter albus TaxID=1473156 RepID=A0AA37SCN8_9GAMM|nr:GNAT family N-acetyltransferase [Litoribrevibacter albus]GLQ33630.1 hypothetical protein GCM10007876_41100 [Litoribrevibacter albus]
MSEMNFVLQSIPYLERQPLIQFYKSNREKIKIHRSDHCYALVDKWEKDQQEKIVAAVKFSALPDGAWLLRNMLVDRAYREQGLGHQLLSALSDVMTQLNQQGNSQTDVGLYCYPWSELTPFYCQHGFTERSLWESDGQLSTNVENVSTNVESASTNVKNVLTNVEDTSVDVKAQCLSGEAVERYQAYRKRGLDIRFCYWQV